MKFLIVSSKISELTKDLINEIKLNNHTYNFSRTKDFILELDNNKFKASASKIPDLFDFDIYLFRSFSKNMTNSRIFIEELRLRKKIVIEGCVSDNYINSKFAEGVRLTRNGINYPQTYQIPDLKNTKNLPKNIFPVIIKPSDGSKGRDIKIIKNKIELKKILAKTSEDFLIQEYLKIKWDLRVFVVNGKALGGIKRHILKGDIDMELLYWPMWFIAVYRFIMRRRLHELPEVQAFTAHCDELRAALPINGSRFEQWLITKLLMTISAQLSDMSLALEWAGLKTVISCPK